MIKRTAFVIIFCSCILSTAKSQSLTNARQIWISTKTDSIVIDSLSLIPGSLFISDGNTFVDSAAYIVDFEKAILKWNKNSADYKIISADSLKLTYRVFAVLFGKSFYNKNKTDIEKRFNEPFNPYVYEPDKTANEIFKMQNLTSQGSISRGVSFGNNQDAVVNSSLNLQLAGRLNKDWEIAAAITDNNIPIQPEGNTQQLQDFDKVFIQLSSQKTKIVAGDFDLLRPKSYFMNFYKKAQGALVATNYDAGAKNKITMRTTGSASISRGKFARNIIEGIEANQGPYRLIGADNETYIVVLSNSEKVYINGQLLKRGQEYDYIIDYNTAEVIFTANRIVTKDSRITVEFQYSDKNYVRTLLYANHEMDFAKAKVRFNFYSEQDLKNQPLFQSLNDSSKQVLADAGDSLQLAVIPSVDSIPYNSNEVLYKKTDSLVSGNLYTNIYVYSTSPDSAFYRLGFSLVGSNNGNYIQVPSSANGKVYQWIAPVNGVLQGNYEPVVQLISPKKKQMITLGSDLNLNTTTSMRIEGAFSNNDLNLFSDADQENDNGYALNFVMNNEIKLTHDSIKPWKLNSSLNYENVYKNFSPVETYRSIEFNRDWNLSSQNLSTLANENIIGAAFNLNKANEQSILYQFKSFLRQDNYTGLMNLLSVNLSKNNFKLLFSGSYLSSKATSGNTNFFRSNTDFSKTIKKIVAGLKQEAEHNKIYINDSLSSTGLWYDQYGAYVGSSENMTKAKIMIEYFRRFDKGIVNNQFEDRAYTDNASLTAGFKPGKNSAIDIGGNFRKLKLNDTVANTLTPSETFLGKINYNQVLLNGGINLNAYYEAGSGQQQKQQFAYVEVAPGTGVYTWTDYNNNAVKELNEFDVAVYQDQADYIKVYIPTNEYVRTLRNQLSTVLNLNPAAFLKQNKSYAKIISRFSNQTAYRSENQTTDDNIAASLNPFVKNILDTNISLASGTFRNTFFFNRSSTVFGTDITWQDLHNKLLTSNGYELRRQRSTQLNVRWNMTRNYSFITLIEKGNSENRSEYFYNRNYMIEYYKTQPVFSFQPNTAFRISFIYLYSNKKNIFGESGETSLQNNGSIEVKFSSIKKGIATFRFNYIDMNYNGEENSPVAYEMLEGLRNGKNITWNVNLQRNLSRVLQLTVNYEGRKSEKSKTIHTAGVQARAFF